ncbi:MAG: DUF2085 domain-containing protein [Candidatus Micrarchaeia archaeon]
MILDWRIGFAVYLLFSTFLVVLVVGAPVAALLGHDNIASALYNAAKPLCHQWIYRSQCILDNGKYWVFDDCIPQSTQSNVIVETKYSSSFRGFDGYFRYSRDQIGINRAEHVIRDGMEGYKIAVCSRDFFMYLGLLIAAPAYLLLRKRITTLPSMIYLLIALVPMGIDGTGQLLGFWESTNLVRSATGLIVGIVMGYYLVFLTCEIFDRKRT